MATASTLTQTLATRWSSSMTLMMREKIDMERLSFLLNNPDVPKETKRDLKKLNERITEGCWAKITYTLGKQAKESSEALGRLNAEGNVGLQGLKRDVRNFLAQRNYFDVDMVSAHPRLCLSLCKRQNLLCIHQEELVNNREEKLSELMDAMGCSRSMAKDYITALYFGEENVSGALPSWFKTLHQEISNARKVITQNEEWTEALKFLNGKKKNRIGSAFSFILQSIELGCLLALERSAKKHGRRLDTYIHDGGLIARREGEDAFPDELLRSFEKDILDDTGFPVVLAVKEMETSWVLKEKDNQAYYEMKEKFEKEVASLNTPPVYLRIKDGEVQQLTGPDLQHIYGTLAVDEEKFLTTWIADPHKRSYERMEFLPELAVPEGTFNIWRGFPTPDVAGDISVIQDVLMTNCNDNKEAFDYVENYIAHLIQKPGEKPGVCICFQSEEEGTGKDTFANFIGDMLGRNLYYSTSKPEDDVFSRFNGSLKQVLLIKFEEADFEVNRRNEGKLKALITSTHTSFEGKGESAVTLRSYCRIIMTTNKEVPFVVNDKDRRFMMIRCSPKNVGNRDYWNATHQALAKPESKSAYFHYLKNKDISAFDIRTYPKTEYLTETITATRPYIASFFQREIERTYTKYVVEDKEPENEVIEWKARELFNLMNEGSKYPITETKLGRDIKNYPVEKVVKRKYASYRIETAKMREFLMKKQWWLDFFSVE